MVILGIPFMMSFNQSACLLVDGEIIGWTEEERLSRNKHSIVLRNNRPPSILFPYNSVQWLLESNGYTMDDVDCVAVGHSDIYEVSRYMRSNEYQNYFSYDIGADGKDDDNLSLLGTEPKWRWSSWNQKHFDAISTNYMATLSNVASLSENIYDVSKVKWYDHHICHVASTVIPSGFDECNYYVADGAGGQTAGRIGHWDGERFNQAGYMHNAGTLGGFYSHITTALGFMKHSEEGKTMGLACWGKRDEKLLPKFFQQNQDGFVQPQSDIYKKYLEDENPDIVKEAVSIKANEPGEFPMSEVARNLAATGQQYLEEIVAYNLEHLNGIYNKSDNLALAGGTMLNCTSNGKIAQNLSGGIYIQPAAHDSGTALGAAILAHKQLTNKWPKINQDTAYYGRDWKPKYIRDFLFNAKREYKIRYESYSYKEISHKLAEFIDDDKVVGYFQGKSEIGPRALCHRSILANPTKKENLQRVNKIKKREWWRPLAPTMMEDYVYDITNTKHPSPFMLMACEVKSEWRNRIPAVVHVDNSCRPQTVNREQNKIIYEALEIFSKKPKGVPVFMNTSFNIGEPLVDSPEDALKTYMNSDIDILILENFIITKGK